MIHQLGYLWAVTLVVWLVTLFYIVFLLRKQTKLQRELDQLSQSLESLHRPR